MLLAALVFVVVLTSIFGAYWAFVLRLEEQDERAVRRRLKNRAAKALRITLAKAPDALSSLGPLDALLSRWQRLIEPLRHLRERAGMKRVTVGAIVLACAFLATVAFAVVAIVSHSILAGIGGALLAGVLPILYVRRAAAKRLAAFEEQFPDAIDLMARALRAGHALPTAIQLVGDEIPAPVGTEFKLLFEQQNYGLSFGDALRGFSDRVPLIDARFFVTALLTQREMGGNLSEVLENLASVIRERFKVKRQVRVVSAHGRITGFVLGCLPPAVGVALFVIAPDHIRILVDDPMGRTMLVGGLALQAIGVVIIRRIIQVEY
jgi:tight adherence protein B